jgi:iron complex transport system permease protein
MHSKRNRNPKLLAGLATGVAVLLFVMLISVLRGIQSFGVRELWQAYALFDGSNEHLLITTVRMPRTLIAAAVGASLAMAGVIMQVLTRNQLASPSVFGINAGASLCVVAALVLYGSSLTIGGMIPIALAGAAITAVIVFVLGSLGGGKLDTTRLTLAGASIAAFSASLTSGLILLNGQALDDALFWMIGSVSGRKLEHLQQVLPYMSLGWLLSLGIAPSLNVMALGDDNAKGLGMRLKLVQSLGAAAVILLAGSSVAAAGPIAFVGLMVPHVCRAIAGEDHRWLLPYSAVAGALLLVGADLLSRFVLIPREVPVGIATALLGVPFLIAIARRRKHD